MSNSCPATRSTLERLCQARRARRAARRLREQQRHGPKVPSNLDILERHTMEVLKRLEVGPLEEVSVREHITKRVTLRCFLLGLCGLKDREVDSLGCFFSQRMRRFVQRFMVSSTKCQRHQLLLRSL